MARKYQVRSVSLPASSHPSRIRVECELNNVRSLEAYSASSSGAVCASLAGLEELHCCLDSYLSVHSTQEILLLACKDKSWVVELLDGSVKILDACSTSRDSMLQVKGHVQDLQSALRRRKGSSSASESVSRFKRLRKKMIKDARNMIATLKQVDHKLRVSVIEHLGNAEDQCPCIISLLNDVAALDISILESLLSYLSVPSSDSKMTKWSSVISRLMNKKVAACKQETSNEFSNVDAAIFELNTSKCSSSEAVQLVLERLAWLEARVERIEDCLESMFKCFIKSRVALLNIISTET
uniref:Uncharacterized protein n=1 Tax=Kalanchoe fedtschenkoi TaxID=63787 RepID=A0A7N0VLL0_KALFE